MKHKTDAVVVISIDTAVEIIGGDTAEKASDAVMLKTDELKRYKGLKDTGFTISQLALKLPPLPFGQTYTLDLDNCFTSIQLFHNLRIVHILACETIRVNNSVDFPTVQIMKENWGHKLPWGTLIAIPMGKNVLCLG